MSHAVRTRAGMLVLGLLSLLGATACLPEAHQQRSIDLINASRNGTGLGDLAWDSQSADKAQRWAEHMADRYAIMHSSLADGITGDWTVLGENVGVGASIDAVHKAFMNSPRHRAAILSGRFRSVGIGIAVRNRMVFIAQEFRG